MRESKAFVFNMDEDLATACGCPPRKEANHWADILGRRSSVCRSTYKSPNLVPYPSAHSKLSINDHAKYPLTSAPFLS